MLATSLAIRTHTHTHIGDALETARSEWENFDSIVKEVELQLRLSPNLSDGGLILASAHILQQGTKLTQFAWHTDNDVGAVHGSAFTTVALTVVVQLSNTRSEMEVELAHKHATYNRAGSAVAFPSDCVHRTGNDTPKGTIKLTLFYSATDIKD